MSIKQSTKEIQRELESSSESEAEVVVKSARKKMTPEEAKAKKTERNKAYYKKNTEYFKARDRSKNKTDALERCKKLVDELDDEDTKELIKYCQEKNKRQLTGLLEGMSEEQRALLKAMLK
jgi:tRNA G18 (ribose-2'-O)-methylase SpoU